MTLSGDRMKREEMLKIVKEEKSREEWFNAIDSCFGSDHLVDIATAVEKRIFQKNQKHLRGLMNQAKQRLEAGYPPNACHMNDRDLEDAFKILASFLFKMRVGKLGLKLKPTQILLALEYTATKLAEKLETDKIPNILGVIEKPNQN